MGTGTVRTAIDAVVAVATELGAGIRAEAGDVAR